MKHKPVKQHEYYKVEAGEVKRLKKVCDRCGDGTFMADHKDRWYCGKCGMTIWKKKEEKKKEKKSEQKTESKSETKTKAKAEAKEAESAKKS